RRGDQHAGEFLLALLAPFGAPGQQVDPCHQSKFLSARPAAIISEGASWASVGAWTRGPSIICASGLAIATGTPSCSSTSCATPGGAAPAVGPGPPASTMRPTRLTALPA